MTKRKTPTHTPGDRIDTLFSMPGARADRWRSLNAAARLAGRISEAILTRSYKHGGGARSSAEDSPDAPLDLHSGMMAHGPATRPYFERLVVSPRATERAVQIAAEIRGLRRHEDASFMRPFRSQVSSTRSVPFW